MNNKKLTKFVFIIYLVILTWLILFKLAISLDEIASIQVLNLIPLKESFYLNGKLNLFEIGLNIIIFIPLGYYLKILFPNLKSYKVIILGLLLSLSYESLQYLFEIGVCDVTDLITNTSGTIIGFSIYQLLKNKFNTFINYFILISMVGLISLYLILSYL